MQKSPARSGIRAAVYGVVVLLLLLLGLFARGFSQNLGDARVGGRYTMFPLFSSRNLESLAVTWNGISLRFSRSSTPPLLSWEATSDGADVLFDGDIRLHLQPGTDVGGSLSLSAAGAGAAGSSLTIPFTVAGILSDPPQGSALAWSRAGKTYLLSLPSGASADGESRTISLPLGGGAASFTLKGTTATVAAVRPHASATTQPVQHQKIPEESAMPTSETLQATVSQFSDKAYAGWTAGRFVQDSSLWTMPDGTSGFSESIGACLLAESLQRGTWQQMQPLWANAMTRQQNRSPDARLSYITCTYLGGVKDYLRSVQSTSAAELAAAAALIAKGDDAALEQPGLVPLLLDHGNAEQLQAGLAFINGRTVASLDVARSVGLLEALVDEAENTQAGQPVTSLMAELVTKKLLPSVRTTDAGVFLDSGNGDSDLLRGIRCGSLLVRAGPLISSTLASAVGRGLISAALGLSDDKGLLPASVAVGSGTLASRKGTLAPESFYQLLPIERLFPREVPLSTQVGAGTWIWTSARLVKVEGTSSGLRLVLGYPAGIAHNFLILGVPAFSQIRMHGIPWHSDPTYYKYSDGWALDADSHTLFMKLTGRSDQEEITITY